MKAGWRIGAVVMCFSWALAPSVGADPIDDFVQAQLEAQKIPGVAVLVMRDGKIEKQRGYGYSNLELQVPVSPETLFQSGSTGKSFTAAGILMLAEEGKLNLDDRLATYYPDASAAWHRITIRQLLTHTSGIKDYAETDTGIFDYRKDYTDDDLLAVIQKLPIEFEPGTQWSYSNSAYVILGLLTTKLSGKHWSEFQSEKIFKPLGMKTTRVISDRDVIPNRAAGYQLDEHGVVVNQDWVSPTFGRTADGALYFSIRDLAAWEKALEARTFMSKQSFEAWWTAVQFTNGTRYPFGIGWFLSEQRGEPLIQHGGAWQGFRASINRYPQQRLAVIILANAAHAGTGAIAREVAGFIDPRLKARSPSAPPTAPKAALTASLRGVLEAWGGFRTGPAMAPALAERASGSAVEAHNRQDVATQVRDARSFSIVGADLLSKAATDLLADGSVTAVDTVLETDKAQMSIRFRLDAEGRVVSFAVYK